MPSKGKAALGMAPETRPAFEELQPVYTPRRSVSQLQPAFRASPLSWPGVDPLHEDPLGDDLLFVEPALYRATIAEARFRVEDVGPLPPATLDRLRYCVGAADFALVISPAYGDGGAYAVMRADVLESLLALADFGPLTWGRGNDSR